jgi:DNA-directed RNA polymerase specialized sigma24 family protein
LSLTGQRVEAEDLLQDVFAKLLEKGKLTLELRPYVFRMVRNGFIDQARKRRVYVEPLFSLQRTLPKRCPHGKSPVHNPLAYLPQASRPGQGKDLSIGVNHRQMQALAGSSAFFSAVDTG